MKADIQAYAEAREQSVGEFIRYCIWTYMDQTPMDEDAEAAESAAKLREELEEGVHGRPLELGRVISGDPEGHKELEDKLDESLRRHTGHGLDVVQVGADLAGLGSIACAAHVPALTSADKGSIIRLVRVPK